MIPCVLKTKKNTTTGNISKKNFTCDPIICQFDGHSKSLCFLIERNWNDHPREITFLSMMNASRVACKEMTMQFDKVVNGRQSVRGYKKDPVPQALIREIIDLARRAPSSMNTQPWHVHVLTGEVLDEVRSRNMTEMAAGAEVKRDIHSHDPYEGVHRERQIAIAKKLFAAMGIAREDAERRQDWVLRGFRQFDAPVSLVLTYDRALDPGAVVHFDLGALCYGIVLAAWDRGLGTVINGQGIMRSDIVREVANIPDDQVIMTCVAMGYPDDSFAANGVRADRETIDDFVTFVGF